MSNRRNALGRGLGALIPGAGAKEPVPSATPRPTPSTATNSSAQPTATQTTSAAANAESAAREGSSAPTLLRVDIIDANPEQPRRIFNEAHLKELSESIKLHGVLQPIVVRRAGARFELIVGERRWRATQVAGLKTIPAVVADIETKDRLEIAIIENVQRQDLNPIELAHAYRALAATGATQDEVGRKVSKDRSSVANHLRLLDLSRDIQEDIEEGRLTMGHAKALLQVTNPERRLHLRNRVVEEGLSVREAELVGRGIAGPATGTQTRKPRKTTSVLDPDMAPVLETLQRQLQTRVRIVGGADRGKIEIDYFEKEDFNRIVTMLLEAAP
jgi:ParB family transcriptional regulator, chromosome partitioning protein